LWFGCAAREIVSRVEDIYVLAIDRSAKAIEQAKKNTGKEIEGKLNFFNQRLKNLNSRKMKSLLILHLLSGLEHWMDDILK